jgi:hypothetical protein
MIQVHSQPRVVAYPVMLIIVALLVWGALASGAPLLGILLLALPVVAFAAYFGLRAWRDEN